MNSFKKTEAIIAKINTLENVWHHIFRPLMMMQTANIAAKTDDVVEDY